MADRSDGGPAFPGTLRDWFAGQALAGLVSVVQTPEGAAMLEKSAAEKAQTVEAFTTRATYQLADAMMAERAKVERGQAPDPTGRSCADTVAVQPAPATPPMCGVKTVGCCLNCGLVLGSDRPYCDVCGCLSTTQGGKLQCTRAKGHVLHHLNGGETWYGDKA